MNVRRPVGVPGRQRGLSLIELMVTLVVSLLLLGGLFQVYLSSKQSYNAQEQLARMQESGRFAMDLITRDLRRAGYWGGSVDLGRMQLGDPGALDASLTSHNCGADTTWGRMIRWRVSGLNNTNAGYGCAEDYDAVAASDVLTVRYAGPTPVPDNPAALASTRLYLRNNTESAVVMTGATSTDAVNTPAIISGDNTISVVHPLVAHAYYVGASGRTCPGGAPIPALRRVRLSAAGTPVSEVLATGVEHLEVRYLVDGQYRDADAIVGNDWLNVSAVRVWLLVRGECAEAGLVNTTAYVMGDRTIGPDNIRRQLYVNTVMLRNTVVGE